MPRAVASQRSASHGGGTRHAAWSSAAAPPLACGLACHANDAHSRHSVFPVPVGDSSSAVLPCAARVSRRQVQHRLTATKARAERAAARRASESASRTRCMYTSCVCVRKICQHVLFAALASKQVLAQDRACPVARAPGTRTRRAGTRRRRSRHCAARARRSAWFTVSAAASLALPECRGAPCAARRRSALAAGCPDTRRASTRAERAAQCKGPVLRWPRLHAARTRQYRLSSGYDAAQQLGRAGACARCGQPQVARARGAPHLRRSGRVGALRGACTAPLLSGLTRCRAGERAREDLHRQGAQRVR